jgi:hypothetical protein
VDRLSHWRVAVWVALCLTGLGIAAALVVPAAFRAAPHTRPQIDASISPRTHLFGQPVTAALEVPRGSSFRLRFTPYRVLHRTVVRKHATVRYEFALICLEPACAGPPGTEHALTLPPVHVRLPNGKALDGYWPPLREASRLAPQDLASPVPRGTFIVPERGSPHRLLGLGLAAGAALALLAAAALGALWLSPRRFVFGPERERRGPLSDLQYALVVTGLAAGGGPDDRRAALESLAVALEQGGHLELAAEARSLAWSPLEPRGDAVRRLAASAQQFVKAAA